MNKTIWKHIYRITFAYYKPICQCSCLDMVNRGHASRGCTTCKLRRISCVETFLENFTVAGLGSSSSAYCNITLSEWSLGLVVYSTLDVLGRGFASLRSVMQTLDERRKQHERYGWALSQLRQTLSSKSVSSALLIPVRLFALYEVSLFDQGVAV